MQQRFETEWTEFDNAVLEESTMARALELAARLPLGRNASDGRSTLSSAAMAGAEALAIELIARGADPLLADDNGWTALNAAAMSGSAALVRAMIDHVAHYGDLASAGVAALDAALGGIGRHRRVAREPSRAIATIAVLLDAGVDPRATSKVHTNRTISQLTGRILLARNTPPELHAQLIDAFVSRGVTLDEIFDEPTDDPLSLVSRTWKEPVLLEYLVAHGASIAGRDGRASVLHGLASRDAERDELKSWIDRGARIEALDARQQTPLLVAAEAGAARSAIALLDLGASPAAVDGQGRNARTLAGARLSGETLVAELTARGIPAQASAPAGQHSGPTPAAIPTAARKARVTNGMFKNFDAWVRARADGGYDAVINMFGRGVNAVLNADEVALMEE